MARTRPGTGKPVEEQAVDAGHELVARPTLCAGATDPDADLAAALGRPRAAFRTSHTPRTMASSPLNPPIPNRASAGTPAEGGGRTISTGKYRGLVTRHPTELFSGAGDLPAHADVLEGLRREVDDSERWRWLELGCSLAAGRGDRLSDVDAAVGYAEPFALEDVDREGAALVGAASGSTLDLLIQAMPAWPPGVRRFAVEYASGVQLDLVLMPAHRRQGIPDGAIAIVDKDARLAVPWRPPIADPPTASGAREWAMLGWWALSDVAKYLRRGSLFEAAERISEARQQALRLFAAARRVPYPAFGLVSLLDSELGDLPDSLDRTYCVPDAPAAVAAAANATADLLEAASTSASKVLQAKLDTAWSGIARRRLAAAHTTP